MTLDKVEKQRLRSSIDNRLGDFPRIYAAHLRGSVAPWLRGVSRA